MECFLSTCKALNSVIRVGGKGQGGKAGSKAQERTLEDREGNTNRGRGSGVQSVHRGRAGQGMPRVWAYVMISSERDLNTASEAYKEGKRCVPVSSRCSGKERLKGEICLQQFRSHMMSMFFELRFAWSRGGNDRKDLVPVVKETTLTAES